ncbi:unnamed protein product [Spirodela intermedia]|uniref:Uncharacterized protein n=1 Tax=Spirodela intermedia TaxID=51605 RepID=A0A7I8JQU1_SPIIN|nr:unnamed protein product [Spirodela intermedia]CAA6672549.1 unnamed protein product [Spirodela intermedia]
MVDSICGGAFMEKTPDEIYSLYENLSENSRDQASFELYDRDKKRGIYELHHDDDSKLRNEVNQINQRLEKIDLLIDNIRKPFNPQLNSNRFQQGESSSMNLGKNPRNENVRTVNALRSGKILPDPYPKTLEEKENVDNPKQIK